jgi:hypothetical protein
MLGGSDTREQLLGLMLMGFEAGREFQRDYPTVIGGQGYLESLPNPVHTAPCSNADCSDLRCVEARNGTVES